MIWFNLHKLKHRVFRVASRVLEGAAVVGIVLFGGLGSSWYMVEAGSRLTTLHKGPWVIWTAAARPDADPYTRAHFVRAGTLPMSGAIEQTYVARRDEAGERLFSSCEYEVAGKLTAPEWWSLSVFDDTGRLIPNPAERYTFTGQTIATDSTGAFSVSLSREARAGNWLPVGGAGRLAVVLKVLDQRGPDSGTARPTYELPKIRKVKCR